MPRRRCWCGRAAGNTRICDEHHLEAMRLTLKLVALEDVVWRNVLREEPPTLEDVLTLVGCQMRQRARGRVA